MRKLVTAAFVSLDGVMQAPGGPDEDPSGGFRHGGWITPYSDPAFSRGTAENFGRPFDLVLGRRTYDIFAAFWPNAGEEEGAKPLNDAVKHVASRGRPELTWERSHLIEGDVVEGVAALKQQDGPELQVHGSGDLIQTLLRHDLVDRYRLLIFPVVVGSGKRLFSEGTIPPGLRLVESKVSTTGVVMGTYEPAGEIFTGSFALD